MSYRPYSAIIAEAQSANSSIRLELKNDTGSTINALSPVTINSDGKLKLINVSNAADASKASGVVTDNISDASLGVVVMAGRIENIFTAFNYGDFVWVSKSGDLTNVEPVLGVGGFVSGDFVIRIGVITRNRTVPANKDLLVQVRLVGQMA